MNRATATTYLTNEYAELATDAKFDAGQTSTAYSAAIDNSLRQLGVAESDLATYDVPQTNINGFLALLNYYTLKRYLRILAIKYDVEIVGAINVKRSQAFTAIKEMLQEAETECVNLGFNVGGVSGFQMGLVGLDFLEPSLPNEFYTYEGF